jgi:MFS family permease
VAIIGALVAMRLPPQTAAPRPVAGAQPKGFWASFGMLMSFPVVRYLVPTVSAIGLCATAYIPLMPSIVAHFFDGRSSTVGMLMSAAGVGALVSAAYLSLQPGYGRTIRLVTAAPLAVGAVLMAFAWSRVLPLSLLLAAGLGASILVAVNATNALLQQSVPDAWRGRAMGLYSMAFAGTAPVGNIVTGSLAERIGLAATLTLNGALIVVAGLLARWRLHNHPEALLGMMRSLSR